MNIGQRIREVREDLGMQAAVLARRVEVAPNTIYRIETGDRLPSGGLLEKIARELRTEPAELMREPVLLGKAEAPQETGPASLDFPDLPGLDATLTRHNMGRGELAYRTGMTPGELFDYEVGAKKPSEEIIHRIADALGCFVAELVFEPKKGEEFLAENQQQNALIQDKRDEWLQEMREELIRNPEARRISEEIKEAYRASDEARKQRRGEEEQNRPA